MDKKARTKNLLLGKTCDSCDFTLYMSDRLFRTCLKKEDLSFMEQTCEGWSNSSDGYIRKVVKQSDFEDFLIKKEMTFKINGTNPIRGVKLYNEQKQIVYETTFAQGPYVFAKDGGSLVLKVD
jgi:hypothetical protein